MIERTLVIGSTGFIGRAVVRLLDNEDWNVVGMRRWDSQVDVLDAIGIPDIVANLFDRSQLIHAMSGMNYVVYCAAPDPTLAPGDYQRRATLAIRNVLSVARDADVERVVVTSTAATIGRPDDDRPATEQEVYLPGSAQDHFVEAAYAVEQECFRQAADNQHVVMVNPSLVLGPGARIPNQRRFPNLTDSDPVNWVDLGRVARAHLGALEWGHRGERYLVAGENGTVSEFYESARRNPAVSIQKRLAIFGPEPYRNRYLITGGQHLDGSKADGEFDL